MAYANDPVFAPISADTGYWQSIIEKFYSKYRGLREWHEQLMNTVVRDGQLLMPTGRVYKFSPKRHNGSYIWPRTNVLNYPVQGMGADLMAIARVYLHRGLLKRGLIHRILPVSTVHDSVLLDFPSELLTDAVDLIKESWSKIPENFEKLFGVEFDLPMRVEIKVGPDWANMEEVQ